MAAKPVFGLVLAGGESRRMGRDKALLSRDGQSQLAHIVALLGDVVDDVFVSTRREQNDDAERSRYRQVVDRFDGIGPVAGILSALQEHPQADWLIVACDLPNIDVETLRFLLDNADPDKPLTAYRSSYDGLPEPLCALYRSDSAAIVADFVEQGIVCPRKILIRSDAQLLDQPDPRSLDNINTPEDLADSVLEVAS